MKHVIVMSLTASIGLMSLFLVDFVDMYFLSLLGEIELAAAIGYAGTILFFTTSLCIGIAISMGALVSKSIGAGKPDRAKAYMMNVYALCLFITVPLAMVTWFFIPLLVTWLGAQGKTHELASAYLQILIPSMPILGLAMNSGAVLRALGDAKRAMYSTLAGGFVNVILDPIFIFVLGMGIQGAAIASLLARCTVFLVAYTPLLQLYKMFVPFQFTPVPG